MISLTTIDGPVTIVRVAAEPGSALADLAISGEGIARCRPGDLFVAATGERIAMGRAIQDFGRQVEEAGCAESVCVEDIERVLTALVLAAAQ